MNVKLRLLLKLKIVMHRLMVWGGLDRCFVRDADGNSVYEDDLPYPPPPVPRRYPSRSNVPPRTQRSGFDTRPDDVSPK